MKSELTVEAAPQQFRPHLLVAAHETVEDFTVYQPASVLQRLYAFALDVHLVAPLVVLVHLPFRRYLERLGAYGFEGRYVALYALIWSLPFILYFIAPTLLWGQTLGKRIVGIRVVKASFGPHIPFGSVLLREGGKILSFGCLGLGLFMALFNERRRGFHDYLGKTQVVTYRVR